MQNPGVDPGFIREWHRPIITVRNSSCGKVMFSQVSVYPRGRCTSSLADPPPPRQTPSLGSHCPRQTHLRADLPRQTHTPGRHPLGRHAPPWADTPLPPGRHPSGQPSPGQTATAADGTHPTGMHSCLVNFQKKTMKINKFLPTRL